MRVGIYLTLVVLLFGILISKDNAQTIQSKKGVISQKHPTTVVGISFTNIAKRSNKCVMISGRSQFNNNFFLDSCIDGFSVKETSSIGYVHDLNYFDEESGWMILSNTIVKVHNNRFIEVDSEKTRKSSFNKIFFVNSQTGWAIGSKGEIIFTTDGGKSWDRQNSNTDFELNEIIFSTPDFGWIIGSKFKNGGTELILLNTVNSGKTWTVIEQPPDNHFVRIFFLDSLNGWAITQNGAMSKTEDGGKTWNQNLAKNTKFEDIFFIDKATGWGVDYNDNFLHTKDGGKTWQSQITLPDISPYNFSIIIFVDKNNGWLWSQEKILQTQNGGKTWQSLDISQNLSKDFLK